MQNSNNHLDKKKEIINKYNASSNHYDKRYQKIQEEKYQILFKDSAKLKGAILDAGCGSGLLFNFLLKKYGGKIKTSLNYIGIDISLEMLKRFIMKIQKWKNNPNLHLVLADLENTPIRRNKFDLVLSITTLQNLPNIYRGIDEIFAIGKRNSNIFLSILKKKLKLNRILSFLNSKLVEIEVKNFENIEDIIIKGKLKEK